MTDLREDIARLLLRDLDALRRELELFPDEAAIWRTVPGVTNPAGTLALHGCGNLRHFIGGQLGGSGYVRDRDAEFGRRDVPRAALLAEVDRARADVRDALARIDAAVLDQPFPIPVAGVTLPAGRFLLHLATHLAFHLGQAGYLRRVLTGGGSAPGVMSPAALAADV